MQGFYFKESYPSEQWFFLNPWNTNLNILVLAGSDKNQNRRQSLKSRRICFTALSVEPYKTVCTCIHIQNLSGQGI